MKNLLICLLCILPTISLSQSQGTNLDSAFLKFIADSTYIKIYDKGDPDVFPLYQRIPIKNPAEPFWDIAEYFSIMEYSIMHKCIGSVVDISVVGLRHMPDGGYRLLYVVKIINKNNGDDP